jgi:uncharacterized protein (TIGR00730 family)
MPDSIRAVTVYCSSSTTIAPEFFDAGRELGRAISANNWKLVYGGNNVGLMGAVADAVRASGGKVIGVTPQLFIDKGLDDKDCEELLVTECMRTRKAAMEARGDAFVALPGGIGTYEELFEMIVGRQLGFHDKPIVLIDTLGYFEPFTTMIDKGIEQGFIRTESRDLFFVTSSIPEAIEHIKTHHLHPELAAKRPRYQFNAPKR